jgi:hypothetical protein
MRRDFNYDSDLLIEDSLDSAGASSPITATQAGKVLDTAKVLDVGGSDYSSTAGGDSGGLFEGNAVIDVSAIEVGTDEQYDINIQGAAASFSGDIQDLAKITLGHSDNLPGTVSSAIGRYVLPFSNEKNGVLFRYLRAYLTLAGTAETITCKIWLTKQTG